MADQRDETSEIKDTDIVFDCPHCGKSLAIDYRGAGLAIPCTDCGESVEVPIPEGMELTDIDSSSEDQEMRILNLRKSLGAAEQRIVQLETEVENLTQRRDALEAMHTEDASRLRIVREQADVAGRALEQITAAFQNIADTLEED